MTDTQYMSAKQKELVLKQWKNFMRKLKACDFEEVSHADYGPFPTSLNKSFTNRLYLHLSNHFQFISHYNRLGFLSALFGSSGVALGTLQTIKDCTAIDTDYLDLNTAMRQAIMPDGHPENVPLTL